MDRAFAAMEGAAGRKGGRGAPHQKQARIASRPPRSHTALYTTQLYNAYMHQPVHIATATLWQAHPTRRRRTSPEGRRAASSVPGKARWEDSFSGW